MLTGRIGGIFPMSLPLDYEPAPEDRLEVLAKAAGVPMEAYLYDHYTGAMAPMSAPATCSTSSAAGLMGRMR